MGTAGWSDATIRKWYPKHIRTNVERLRHYSTHFPCVEVDSSNYAIPHSDSIMQWLGQTPPTFVFHFKVFGMFTSLQALYTAIPTSVRHLIAPNEIGKNGQVKLSKTSDAFKHALWSVWNATLRPVYENGRLGVVIFQFQLNFAPSEENKEHIRWCRSMLDPSYGMAIEFRNRQWVRDEATIRETVEFAKSVNCALVAEDDLEHEVIARFTPLPPGVKPVHLPIILRVAAPHCLYIRMHRRQGQHRILADWEFRDWAQRIHDTLHVHPYGETLQGPICYIIGTDWEDQPIINSNKLQAALEEFDKKKQQQWEEKRMAAAASSATAAASSTPVQPLPPEPEPLSFDYPAFHRQHLSRMSSNLSVASSRPISAFFKQQSTTSPKKKSKLAEETLTLTEGKREMNAATETDHDNVPSNASASAPSPPSSFVTASTLFASQSSSTASPAPPSQRTTLHSFLRPAATPQSDSSSSTSTSTSTSASIQSQPQSQSQQQLPVNARSSNVNDHEDVAAEVERIENVYRQQQQQSHDDIRECKQSDIAAGSSFPPAAAIGSRLSPVKRSLPSSPMPQRKTPTSPPASSSARKKQKTGKDKSTAATSGTATISSFFSKRSGT